MRARKHTKPGAACARRKRAIELDHPRRFSQRYEAASRTLRKLLRFSHGNIVIA